MGRSPINMKVIVETGKWANRYVNERALTLELPKDATVSDIVSSVGIPADEAGIAVLGGKAIARGYVLSDGDVVTIHPVIVGG